MNSKKYRPIASLATTRFGAAICTILSTERPIELGYLSVIRACCGQGPGLDEGPEPGEGGSGDEPFIAAFRHLCPEGELRQTLPRYEPKRVKGNFLFRVGLERGVWRTIKLSSVHTLHELHEQIQRAFNFDNDHLYEFFMDNRRWSEYSIGHPAAEDTVPADEVAIGDADLSEGQSILYLFDFGDEWLFDVKVLEIREGEPVLLHPAIVEEHGEAPLQYDYEEEWEWEEVDDGEDAEDDDDWGEVEIR